MSKEPILVLLLAGWWQFVLLTERVFGSREWWRSMAVLRRLASGPGKDDREDQT